MQSLLTPPDTDETWKRIAPLLETVIDNLSERDRNAVVLRFFEAKTLAEVGEALGLSEDGARMRVTRALEKLRASFEKRGVTLTVAAIAGGVAANAVQAAPAGLISRISTALAAGTAAPTTAVIMTITQKIAVTAALTATVGAGIFEARQAANARAKVQALQQKQELLAGQLQDARDAAARRPAGLLADQPRSKSDSTEIELLKLRGEVARIQSEATDPTENAAKAVAAKVKWLKQRLDQMPDKKIPELQFISDKDWADAVWDADLTTSDGVREALSKVRDRAESIFLGDMMQAAFKKYLAENNDMLPADLSQLKPYFDVPVTDEMLQRYQLLQTGKPDDNADLVKLGVFADEDYDSNHYISLNGAGGGRFNKVQQAVNTAAGYFSADNGGQMPDSPSQVAPYLKMTIDPVTIQKYLDLYQQAQGQIAAHPPSPEVVTLAPALKTYAVAHNGESPKNPSDLLPYLTTPEQQAALLKLEQRNGSSSK